MKYFTLILTFFASVVAAQTVGWKQLPGPIAGSIYSLEVAKDNRVFAITSDSKVYRSDYDQKHWDEITFQHLVAPDLQYIYRCNLDIKGNHYMLISGGSGTLETSYGLYRSSDGGNSWQQVLKSKNISLVKSSNNNGKLYCVGFHNSYESELMVSIDNGLSWETATTFPFYTTDFIVVNDTELLFSILANEKSILSYNTSTGLFKSLHPEDITARQTYSNIALMADVPIAQFSDGVYVIDPDRSFHKRSTLGFLSLASREPLLSTNKGTLFTITADSITQIYSLQYSIDTGSTWTTIESIPNIEKGYNLIIAVDSIGDLYCGNNVGIYKTTDHGAYWKPIGLPMSSVASLQKGPGGTLLATEYTTSYQVLQSDDGGVNWYPPTRLPNNSYPGIFFFDSLGGTYNIAGNILWYSDSSDPYSFEMQGASPPLNVFSQYQSFISIPYKNGIYIGTYFSSDKGITWEAFDYPDVGHVPTSFSIDHSGRFYLGFSPSLYSSVDEGKTWAKIATPLKNTTINNILFSELNTIILGTTSAGVWKSEDKGVTWKRWDPDVRDSVLEMKIAGGRCYITSSRGILSCSINGNDWRNELFADEKIGIYQLLTIDSEHLFASVSKKGIWTNDLNLNSVHTSYSTNDNIRVSYDGSGNGIDIYLTLFERKDITLSLYDILGKNVMPVANGFYERGETIIPFSSLSLGTGIYTLLMRSKDGVILEKIIVTD